MAEVAAEREYPYHYGKEFLGCFSVAAVLLAVVASFCFYEAMTTSDPVEVRKGFGRVKLGGTSANLAVEACGVVALLLMAWCLKAVVNEYRKSSGPKLRIAFLPTGIALPRTMDSTLEEFVPYADISKIEVEEL